MRSSLAAYASPSWFESEGVPIVGHDAQIIDYKQWREGDRDHEHVVFHVDPPGRVAEVIESEPREQQQHVLRYHLTDGGHPEIVRVQRGSVLHGLQKVSSALAGNLSADEAGAARFVLTGEWPPSPPLEAEMGAAAITITSAPWVSAKTLRSFFLQVQRRYRKSDNRPVEDKALEVLTFVTEHTDAAGQKQSWEKLRKLWNERYPERPYKRREDLMRAYNRAAKVLLPAPSDAG